MRPEKIPYAIDRYTNETNRLYGVLNKRLADREFVAGDYSIADMAILGWAKLWERQGQDIEDFPHFKRWLDTLLARPAVQRGLAVNATDRGVERHERSGRSRGAVRPTGALRRRLRASRRCEEPLRGQGATAISAALPIDLASGTIAHGHSSAPSPSSSPTRPSGTSPAPSTRVIEKAGLRIVAQKRMRMTRREAETFYAVHKERPFFGELVDFMISGPVVVQVLEGENAVAEVP